MDEVVIRPPGRDKPGYLRRLRKALEMQERLAQRMSLADLEEMVAFVLTEAEVSGPPDAVRDALFDLSKMEWDALLRATTGGAATGGAATGGAATGGAATGGAATGAGVDGVDGAEVDGAVVDPLSDG
jgi:hypothetical protein